MSLEKAIKHKKEHRQPYYDSRRFDWTCRSHGRCSYCERNRLLYRRLFKIIEVEETDRLYCFWERDFIRKDGVDLNLDASDNE